MRSLRTQRSACRALLGVVLAPLASHAEPPAPPTAPPPPAASAPSDESPAPPAPPASVAPALAETTTPAPAPAPVQATAPLPASQVLPPLPPAAASFAPPAPSLPRPAAHGLQAAFGSGLMLPLGKATGAAGDSLVRRFGWQIPLEVALGFRFERSFFVGAYASLSLGPGPEGGNSNCTTPSSSNADAYKDCGATGFRAGLEASYFFAPAARIDPWLGYGFGFEVAHAEATDLHRNFREELEAFGWTYAQVSAGVDFRGKAPAGVGPFLALSLGGFNHQSTELEQRKTTELVITDRALHAWLVLGARGVTNP